MLNLSKEVFNALLKYLSGESSIDDFRDYMVGLRVDKYRLLADADRLFLDEFEGRYAEFSDFGGDESVLKSALAAYVKADETATGSNNWSLVQSSESSGSFSISVGSPTLTGNFATAVTGH